MVITNSKTGNEIFLKLEKQMCVKEFPVQCGIDSNYCLTNSTKKPQNRDNIIKELSKNGYENTAKKRFRAWWGYRIYWLIPTRIRALIRKYR